MTTEDTTIAPRALPPQPGIRGWLALLAAGVVLAPVNAGLNLLGVWQKVFASGLFMRLTDPANPDFDPLWRVVFVSELSFHAAMAASLIVLAVLFFNRSRRVPLVYAALSLSAALFLAADFIAMRSLVPHAQLMTDAMLKSLLGVGVSLCIWTPYLFLSERAQITFIR